MNLKQFSLSAIVMALTLISAPTPARAQDTTIKNKHQAELLVPRPGREPVKSLNGRTDALDTLDTADPFIKILLFSDYTWKYWKDPSYARDSKIFNEYWTHERPDPYGVELSELPNEIALWIVDTLSSYRCPVIGAPSSRFGYRHRRRHQGVDIPLQTGTPVYAAFDGKVRVSKYHKGYGNLVVVRHDNGLETVYGHLSKHLVKANQKVRAGEPIGLGGNTGRSTGSHLHFETRLCGVALNPALMFDFKNQDVTGDFYTYRRSTYSRESERATRVNGKPASQVATTSAPAPKQQRAERQQRATRQTARSTNKQARQQQAARGGSHTVSKGETLYSIARKNGTTVDKLCKLNHIGKNMRVRIGQKIRTS